MSVFDQKFVLLPGRAAISDQEFPSSERSTLNPVSLLEISSQLKSITGGTGSYTMEYSHDERTPPNVQADVVKAFKPKEDE